MAGARSAPTPGTDASQCQNLPWFQSKIGDSLTPACRQLLEEYSGVKSSEVESHVYKIVSLPIPMSPLPCCSTDAPYQRDMAWEIFPWPCVGNFWFINLGLSLHPSYQTLLARLRSPSTPKKFLDLGCCLGQDLRKLAFDGVPVQSLYGSDIRPDYESIGHELFRDAGRFKDRFISTDFFAEDAENELVKTEGSWDAIGIMMFLHLYDRPTQIRACKRILKLLSRKPGSMVIGTQSASTRPGEGTLKPPFVIEGEHKTAYQHNAETFEEMWQTVEKDEGVRLKVSVVYENDEDREKKAQGGASMGKQNLFPASHLRMLFFTVEIV